MKNIKILDCTLRDGGYVNNWEFSDKQILNILSHLEVSNVDIIECGYLNTMNGQKNNSTLFDNMDSVDAKIKMLSSYVEKVIMINLGDYNSSDLPEKEDSFIDGIRLAFHKKDIKEALTVSTEIISKGYKLFFQPMVTKSYTDLEYLALIKDVSNIGIYAFYIVDSFGSMTLKEFERYLIIADNNLSANIELGYHSHNNMQLAYSNAIKMCSSQLNRNIIIDSSIYGIGRGAGNLNTELIVDYLNVVFEKKYNSLPLLETIDELLNPIMSEKPWGFSPAQYLSASFDCHPNYAAYLIGKNTNHIVGIQKILSKLPLDKKISFDKSIIDELYINFLLQVNTSAHDIFKIPYGKKILLIASGAKVSDYTDLINEKINSNKYISISLNHKSSFDTDFYFFSNQKRFDEFQNDLEPKRIIITSNILQKKEIKIVVDFSSLVFVNNKFVPNVAIVILNYLISKSIKFVEIAGLDGYQKGSNNYCNNTMNTLVESNVIIDRNNDIFSALTYLENKIKIKYITPSIFNKKDKISVLGVIPARYKSSRFKGKPLCIINNVPMIKRTYLQAKKSKALDELIVATESKEIESYCISENIPVIMTNENCLTGTDRIAEVSKSKKFDLYVNIQGDEPVIDPDSISTIINEYTKYGEKYVAYNLYKNCTDEEEIGSDTIIKVIVNEEDELIYMSRLGVPFNKSNEVGTYKKQVCVYGFTKKALDLFSNRSKTLNEKFEDIEILRFIDLGYKVKMKETLVDSIAVDIPSDVQKVEKFLNKQGLE